MTDREIRSQLYRTAKENGVSLPDSFGMGDGSFNGSTGCSELAKKVYETMRVAMRSQMANPKRRFKKTIIGLANVVSELDKPNADINLLGIERKFGKVSSHVNEPAREHDAVGKTVDYVRSTINGLKYVAKVNSNAMVDVLNEAETKLTSILNMITENVVDGASFQANQIAQKIVNLIVDIRDQASNGVLTDTSKIDAVENLVKDWMKLVKVPSKAERCPEDKEMQVFMEDSFAANERVGIVRAKGEHFFAIVEEKKKIEGSLDEIKASLDKVDAEIDGINNQIADLERQKAENEKMYMNGKLTFDQLEQRDADIADKIDRLEDKLDSLYNTQDSVRMNYDMRHETVEAVLTFIGTYEELRFHYNFLSQFAPDVFVALFDDNVFDYAAFVSALSNPTPETVKRVGIMLQSILDTVQARTEAAAQGNKAIAEQLKASRERQAAFREERQKEKAEARAAREARNQERRDRRAAREEQGEYVVFEGRKMKAKERDRILEIRARSGQAPVTNDNPVMENNDPLPTDIFEDNGGGRIMEDN